MENILHGLLVLPNIGFREGREQESLTREEETFEWGSLIYPTISHKYHHSKPGVFSASARQFCISIFLLSVHKLYGGMKSEQGSREDPEQKFRVFCILIVNTP